jgi:hypothetical protein
MRRTYNQYTANKRAEYGDKFDPSDLNPAFIPALESGQRIEVKIYGEIKRGTVGVTTGWKPSFLLMLRSNSRGSSYLLDGDAELIRYL